jgi:hypothetical protein
LSVGRKSTDNLAVDVAPKYRAFVVSGGTDKLALSVGRKSTDNLAVDRGTEV